MKSIKYTLKLILATLLILGITVPVVVSQKATPTIPPPRIVSATPPNFTPAATATLPVADATATIQPPRIVSATPDLSNILGASGMRQPDELLLQRAVDASFEKGFAFTLNAQLDIKTADDRGVLQIRGNGFIDGLNNPTHLMMQATLNVEIDIDGETAKFLIEERIVDGNFYARGESLDNGRKTRWFGYSFSTFIDDLVNDFNFMSLPGFGDANADDAAKIDALANLLNLESFITTRRFDTDTTGEARFVTEIDLEQLMDSPDTLSIVLSMLSAARGIQLDKEDIEPAVQSFSTLRRVIVPDIDWTFERYIDVESETITRAEFDLDFELNLPADEGLETTPVEVALDAIFVLGGYGETYNVEAPPDALIVETPEELQNLDLLIPEG